jgi:potassium-transporting ATPase KdpC subunit
VVHPYLKKSEIPSDMVTASGSGLDPNISPQGALVQIKRVAKERNLAEAKVKALVDSKITTAVVGPETVNVLELNVALDELR